MITAAALRPAATAGPEESGPSSSGRRFFDANNGVWMVKVFPGEYYVTSRSDEVLVTILGSCVSACIRDPRTGIGGMNHFMLAQGQSQSWDGDPESARYGNFAMEKLINELLKAGCSRQSLEIKVFGGGNVTDTRNLIGTQNCEFVLRYLESEGLPIAAQDLGGQYPRRIHYYPSTGRVVRRLLAGSETTAIAREESEYAGRLKSRKVAGEIELFE
ncbi:MAG TPA: chemoreceptor glutamine deamidase CheD [Xanthobacteraceae bacterium]|nr:chemoreceptor glutamine deamidase CheD [Xanthobacteraceae bacterium]